MLEKRDSLTIIHKAIEANTLISNYASYRSLDTAYSSIYLDFSMCNIPYESIKDSYTCLRETFTEIYLDYSSVIIPYESIKS